MEVYAELKVEVDEEEEDWDNAITETAAADDNSGIAATVEKDMSLMLKLRTMGFHGDYIRCSKEEQEVFQSSKLYQEALIL